VDARDLASHVAAQLRVEVRQGLVEQEDLRLAHDGTTDRDALTLTARERLRLAIEVRLETEIDRDLVHALLDLGVRDLLDAERERHVLEHAHVRVERVALEHHRDVALGGRDMGDVAAVDRDLSRGRLLETRDHAQGRRLAAATGADEDDHVARRDRQIEIRDHRARGALVHLADLGQLDVAHARA
jgi:hypothetical protein